MTRMKLGIMNCRWEPMPLRRELHFRRICLEQDPNSSSGLPATDDRIRNNLGTGNDDGNNPGGTGPFSGDSDPEVPGERTYHGSN